jgi:hypothetical protein
MVNIYCYAVVACLSGKTGGVFTIKKQKAPGFSRGMNASEGIYIF